MVSRPRSTTATRACPRKRAPGTAYSLPAENTVAAAICYQHQGLQGRVAKESTVNLRFSRHDADHAAIAEHGPISTPLQPGAAQSTDDDDAAPEYNLRLPELAAVHECAVLSTLWTEGMRVSTHSGRVISIDLAHQGIDR